MGSCAHWIAASLYNSHNNNNNIFTNADSSSITFSTKDSQKCYKAVIGRLRHSKNFKHLTAQTETYENFFLLLFSNAQFKDAFIISNYRRLPAPFSRNWSLGSRWLEPAQHAIIDLLQMTIQWKTAVSVEPAITRHTHTNCWTVNSMLLKFPAHSKVWTSSKDIHFISRQRQPTQNRINSSNKMPRQAEIKDNKSYKNIRTQNHNVWLRLKA